MVLKGVPEHIRSDNTGVPSDRSRSLGWNGPEFVARDLRKWLAATGAKTLYIEPGSPWENGYSTPRSKLRGGPGYCESFNSKLRDEFLNGEIFYSMKEIRVLAERWRVHYNTVRPHSALGYKPPAPQAWAGAAGTKMNTAFNEGHGKVESKERFPLSHAPGYCDEMNQKLVALH